MDPSLTRSQRRLGPHLAILVYDLSNSLALTEWVQGRLIAVGIGADAVSRSRLRTPKVGPPDIRFVDVSDAVDWSRGVSHPTVFTWVLQDHGGMPLAVSAFAFPAIVMAERDARTVQEFAEELTLHLVVNDDADGFTWFADRDGIAAMFSPRSYPSRADALGAATVAVGLFSVATVAGYAVKADTE